MRYDLNFNEAGLLNVNPPVKHIILKELHEYFVLRFPESKTRAELYDNFLRYVMCLNIFVKVHGILINGSFVTDKLDPNDIDFSPVIDGLNYEAIHKDHRKTVEILIDHNNILVRTLRCHPYKTIFFYPEGHKNWNRTQEEKSKALKFWCNPGSKHEKGILMLKF